jgi:hypothetical protein
VGQVVNLGPIGKIGLLPKLRSQHFGRPRGAPNGLVMSATCTFLRCQSRRACRSACARYLHHHSNLRSIPKISRLIHLISLTEPRPKEAASATNTTSKSPLAAQCTLGSGTPDLAPQTACNMSLFKMPDHGAPSPERSTSPLRKHGTPHISDRKPRRASFRGLMCQAPSRFSYRQFRAKGLLR